MNRLTSIAAAAVLLAAPMTVVANASSAAPRGTTAPVASTTAAKPAADTLATQRVAEDATPEAGGKTAAASTGPVIGLSGRGFGHGRGMSQWGARGAASQGRTVAQILDFYYPGTTSASIGNPQVRVRLSALGTSATSVYDEAGLTLTDGTCTAALTQPGATEWRVQPLSGGKWNVQSYYPNVNGFVGWWNYPTTCPGFGTAADLTFVGDGSIGSSVLSVRTPSGKRQYRGGIRAAQDNRPGLVGFTATINVVLMDSYLRSVVPAEMPASWGLEAVKAQAVAARTYAAARLGSPYTSDICDTTSCQVYPGLTSANPEHPNSDAAVAGTSGQIRKYGTTIANTEFSSTNGGQIVGSGVAYQVAKADPYDGVFVDAPDTWTYLTMPVSAITDNWSSIGQFVSMSIGRDGKGAFFGGRADTIVLNGTATSVAVGAETFRTRLNLRSTYLIPLGSSVGTDFASNAFSDLIARDSSGVLWNYPTDGRGGWLARTPITSGHPAVPEILAPGDFSGDGIPDLLRRSTTGTLTLDRGTGTGTIASSSTVGSGWQSFTAVIAPGDLDGDGNVDLLGRDATGTLWLYPSTGTGSWKSRVSKGAGWGGLRELEAIGDFDGDGGTDLMAKSDAGALFLLRFSKTGAYLGAKTIGSGFATYSGFTGLGDVDGDGAVDLVAKDSAGALWAYRGTGTGGFATRLKIGSGWSTLTFGS
ncbi:sporulation protein SpoIID-related protein [Janibacter sp. HTCC2649]|uniref:SpoIID/LytB domain-containing protein n=1 Tax=Janibacter sp. HTCC2649 TaxID=313589 RepID=UPI0000670E84|nr:SpoIID/LytB domain-containing protein [Janibacter sp. HTCC2649]EAP97283.1 sporulation protein SpoIID-related protein [Janibacter sp. HTCC2649]